MALTENKEISRIKLFCSEFHCQLDAKISDMRRVCNTLARSQPRVPRHFGSLLLSAPWADSPSPQRATSTSLRRMDTNTAACLQADAAVGSDVNQPPSEIVKEHSTCKESLRFELHDKQQLVVLYSSDNAGAKDSVWTACQAHSHFY